MKRCPMIPLPITLGMRVAEVSTGFAVFGAITEERALSFVAAAVSVGAVLVPRLVDWYRAIATARRVEHAADLQLSQDILAEEVRKRVELEAECKSLREEISATRHKLRGQEQTIANLTAQLTLLNSSVSKLDSKVAAISPPDGSPAPGPSPAGPI